MGGAVGHLQHLYDNRDLTFSELKSILMSASSGELEKVTEKFDGLNLVFSFDVSEGVLKVSRSSGDIKRGGMDSTGLSSKFAGRGNLTKAFNDAFKVLEGALSALSAETKKKIFGPSANRWYSMEIIYASNPNVINYDSNSIVFHGWPLFTVKKDGKVSMSAEDAGGVEILTANIEKMQKAVERTDWKVSGPAITRMKSLSDGSTLKNTLSAITSAMSRAGVSDKNTIGDYLRALLEENVKDLGLESKVEEAIVSRCMDDDYAPTLIDIKKLVDKSKYDAVRQFVGNCPSMLKEFVRPLELAINDFAIEILKGLKSTLIDDSEKEIIRVRKEVERAISSIQSSGDPNAMSVLSSQMQKLKSLENITSPVEGVVFIYKGNAYKFTGSFAAVNQILGLFKYGKGTKSKSASG